MSSAEEGDATTTKAVGGLEIFADDTGKEVFDAFEKLGSELNTLTENLERQYDDDKDSDIDGLTAGLDNINVKGIIAASAGGPVPDKNITPSTDSDKQLRHSDSLDNLLDVLKDSIDEESTPVDQRRHSVASVSESSGSPQKISTLINNLRQHSLSMDETSLGGEQDSQVVDEWTHDDDTGYTIITLSEEEFYDYEEETSARILQERKEAAAKARASPKVSPKKPPTTTSAFVASPAATVSAPAAAAKVEAKKPDAVSAEPAVYEAYDSDGSEKFVDLATVSPVPAAASVSVADIKVDVARSDEPTDSVFVDVPSVKVGDSSEPASATSSHTTPVPSPTKVDPVTTSTGERDAAQAPREPLLCSSPVAGAGAAAAIASAARDVLETSGTRGSRDSSPSQQLAAKVVGSGGFGTPATSSPVSQSPEAVASQPAPVAEPAPAAPKPSASATNTTAAPQNRRQSVGEQRRTEIMGQKKFQGVDGVHCYFNLKVIFEPYRTGFEENKDLQHSKGTVLAGRYEVHDVLGTAAFSTALQCLDLAAEEDEAQWVCLKVIKNNKDFFDQSLDEIKLLQYINSCGDPDEHHVLRLIDFFYCKEHLFIVSELLKENLYEFGRFIRESNNEPYYTMPRLKRIMKQVLEALVFIHSLKLIHCDIKPENIVIKSFSRCEVKLIDFGSSCFTTDHLTTYIQSRSYRAPEVIIGHPYDTGIDIWSVGAVLAELHTGYVLFQNDSVATMLSRITGILGQFPQNVLQRGKDTGKYFSLSNIVYERDEEGSFHLIFPKRTTLASRLHLPEEPTASTANTSSNGVQALSADEEQFVDFVRQMLHLDPALRMSATQALAHPWLSDADTIYVSEYIIGQNTAQDYAPPVPGSQYEYDDDASEELESGEEEDEGEDEEAESMEGSQDYDYADEDEDLAAAEAEEAALQYLINAHGGTAEAMEAYLRQMQLQQLNDGEGGEEEEGDSGDGEGYFEGLEGSEDGSEGSGAED